MPRVITLAMLLLPAAGCCFFYPGEGKCDPATFENECRDGAAVNCSDVTPVGYGMGVIARYAALSTPCGSDNVCIETSWGDAACVAPQVEACRYAADETRCVDGFEQECRVVEAPRPHDTLNDNYWVATRKHCGPIEAVGTPSAIGAHE